MILAKPVEPESSSNADKTRREKQQAWRQVGEYSGLALALPIAAVLGYAAGSWLDARLGIQGLHVVGLLLGIASGFTQLVRKALRDSKQEEASARDAGAPNRAGAPKKRPSDGSPDREGRR